jgi:hypothetical protein
MPILPHNTHTDNCSKTLLDATVGLKTVLDHSLPLSTKAFWKDCCHEIAFFQAVQRAFKVSFGQVGSEQIGPAQVSVAQVGLAKIGPAPNSDQVCCR